MSFALPNEDSFQVLPGQQVGPVRFRVSNRKIRTENVRITVTGEQGNDPQSCLTLLEEDSDIFIKHLNSMGINPDKEIKEGSLILQSVPIYPKDYNGKVDNDIESPDLFITQLWSFLDKLHQEGKSENYKIVVFDTLSIIKDFFQADNIKDIRFNMLKLFRHPGLKNVVSFFISEKREYDVFNLEDYLVDGIFDLRINHGKKPRPILFQCLKMRGHDIHRGPIELKYSGEGTFSIE